MKITLVKYPNINAKLKAMYANRLTKENINDLIKQNNIKNVVLLLKNKSDIFKNTYENIDRLEIEKLLDESQIKDILKIKKLLNKTDNELFYLFLRQYEIKCVKSILRKLYSDDKTNDIIVQSVKMWTTNLFNDIKGFETIQNFDDFFKTIKRTGHYSFIKKYQNNEIINIFEIENEIDKLYFEKLYDKVNANKNLKKIIGSEIDLLNIEWIIRIKKYYNFDKQRLEKILINRYYKLKPNILNRIMNTNSFDEIKTILSKTPYKNVFASETEFEDNTDRFLYKINYKVFKEDAFSIAYIFAYINLVDYENNDIINVIEGIRYKMDKEEIIKRLAR